ncbi:hypothetical protein ACRALDRAFT_207944 [Sodiomyces alcalophilus JCM 7366]|uniref:uncharacterized protein n=1 Tax=Sodiomyces alcalophilus JCM 7366 TaxID=591952 RepID=UPI0039B61EEB
MFGTAEWWKGIGIKDGSKDKRMKRMKRGKEEEMELPKIWRISTEGSVLRAEQNDDFFIREGTEVIPDSVEREWKVQVDNKELGKVHIQGMEAWAQQDLMSYTIIAYSFHKQLELLMGRPTPLVNEQLDA